MSKKNVAHAARLLAELYELADTDNEVAAFIKKTPEASDLEIDEETGREYPAEAQDAISKICDSWFD